ncbi:hypothetical protein [Micromonospora endolithica]|uniref:DUF2933 domain-containing protein n=1 Tax=Micromonospora endolithica TaxID=230091 RepID=A0A3A9ZQS1_9ACTN|nr:hypothetical protein [Micromonospora endolithica]RKN50294.1 hypothetical protein D7223_00275 [Micromonospora endolithica]TWJ21055.1 hypothetical protein JD76_01155 [Micromonospora endolithica]
MEKLVYLLPILVCPLMMSAMMWMMMRGNHTSAALQPGSQEEIAALRAEVATLRAGQQASTGTGATA